MRKALAAKQEFVAACRKTHETAYRAEQRALQDLQSAEWSLWSLECDAQPVCPHCGRKEHQGCFCPA